jgi:hypothetical protein
MRTIGKTLFFHMMTMMAKDTPFRRVGWRPDVTHSFLPRLYPLLGLLLREINQLPCSLSMEYFFGIQDQQHASSFGTSFLLVFLCFSMGTPVLTPVRESWVILFPEKGRRDREISFCRCSA